MTMTRISALISDVDGTIVTSDKAVTERTRKATAELHARGIKVAIISGRPPEGMRMLIEPLQLTTPITGFNGGAFTRPDMTILEERVLASKISRQAFDFLEKRGIDVWVYNAGEWLIRDAKAAHVEREEFTVKFAPKVVPEFGKALDAAHKIVGVSNDRERLAKCETEVQTLLGADASATRSQPYYLDITHPLANKGAAVGTLAKLMGVTMDTVAVIGDGNNDVGMFAKSPLSIAMGNASDEVKKQARFTTESNDDEGFANALERYLLTPGGTGSA
jgi:Cof subfamily protein (haloacid dehalogenase superfamily)